MQNITSKFERPWSALLLALFIFVMCYFFSGFLSASLFEIFRPADAGKLIEARSGRNLMRSVQALATFFSFGLSYFLWAIYTNRLIAFKNVDLPRSAMLIGLSLLLILVAQPFVQALIIHGNLQWLPESFQNLISDQESRTTGRIMRMLGDLDFWGISANVIVFCLLPAIMEELFFRELLTKTFLRVMPSHLAIWLGAFLFSALHFSLGGFLARFVLGGILGYLMLWTGKVSTSMWAHFFHNLINLIFGILAIQTMTSNPDLNSREGTGLFIVLLSGLCSLLLLIIFARLSRKITKAGTE